MVALVRAFERKSMRRTVGSWAVTEIFLFLIFWPSGLGAMISPIARRAVLKRSFMLLPSTLIRRSAVCSRISYGMLEGVKVAVAVVAEAGDDEFVFVEAFVGDVDDGFDGGVCLFEAACAFWGSYGECAEDLLLGKASFEENVDCGADASAGGKHWVENYDDAFFVEGWKVSVIFVWDFVWSGFVAFEAEKADFGGREIRHECGQICESGAENWQKDDVSGVCFALGFVDWS